MPAKVVKMEGFFTFMQAFNRLPLHRIMTEKPDSAKQLKEKIVFSLIYLAATALLLPFTLWYVNNPDSFQYISITEKLKAGHFYHSLNGYWGPLTSWLVLIPALLGINTIIAFKIVQIVIGFLTLHAWYRLSILSGISKKYRTGFCLIIIPFIISYALLNLTADLLFLCLALYVIINLVKWDWTDSKRSAILSGLLGGGLFYAKGFGFPLFLTLFAISIMASEFLFGRKVRWKLAGILLSAFLLACIFWIGALSIKYGELTISRAAGFNMSKEVAPLPGKTTLLPVLNGPLLSPADEFAISAWESPGEVVKTHPLEPISSLSDREHYREVIKRNLLSIWYYDFRNQTGIIFAALLLIFLVLGRAGSFGSQPIIIFLFLVILIFYGGYSLILVHTRYVWICTGLMILLSAWMLDSIGNQTESLRKPAWIIFVFLILLAVKRPVKEILFAEDADVPLLWIRNAVLHPFETMRITYREDRQLHDAAIELKKFPEMGGRLASLMSDDTHRNRYAAALLIASQTGASYFGQLKNELSADSVKSELIRHEISAFLVWNRTRWTAGKEDWVQLLYEDDDSGLSVYKILRRDQTASEPDTAILQYMK